MKRLQSILCLALTATVSVASAQTTRPATTQAVTQPAAADLELHEWAVFVIDASTAQLNSEGAVTPSFPAFVTDHRFGAGGPPVAAAPSPGNRFVVIQGQLINIGGGRTAQKSSAPRPVEHSDEPSPVGIIRLTGSTDSKVDVSIGNSAGSFLGSWPRAEERSNQLLWRDLTVADHTDNPLPPVDPGSWFAQLRSANSAFVSSEHGGEHAGCEKFLMYDIQMPYPSPLGVKTAKDAAGNSSVQISNTSKVPLHDLTLYQGGEHDSLRTATIDVLMPSQPPAAARAGTSIKTSAAATQPTTATSQPDRTVFNAQLNTAPTTQPIDLADDWKTKFTQAGIDPADADLLAREIALYAFDGHRLTAVYRMDDAEFNRLLPLEVVPQPAKITRYGLVIVRNADPAAPTEIDDLIVQLGDPEWSRRDAAYKALAAMGPAPRNKLQTASKSTDLEVAWRAERLLAIAPVAAK